MTRKNCLIAAALLLNIFFPALLRAQNETFTAPAVRTAFFVKENIRPAYPVLNLSDKDDLTLFFDILSGDTPSLYYKLIHCDRNWNYSDLFYSDYIEGFEENTLSAFGSSFNTRIAFSHYRLTLPNDDVRFRISGNYLLMVYRYGEEDAPLLRRRIMVYEGSCPMNVTFRQPIGKDLHSGQETEVRISLNADGITDPYRQVTLTILQNGRWDNAKKNLRPDFTGNSTVEYNTLNGSTLFNGGNEFRFFDIKNIRQKLQNVRSIDYVAGNYQVLLLPSEDRGAGQYFYSDDLNGAFLVAREGSDEPDLDADYVYVFFTLPAREEIAGGSVYVAGALANMEYTPENRMVYNHDKRCYEASLLLKQGWYNYEYVFIPDGGGTPDDAMFEGSHSETENDYLMLLYFDDPAERTDRLLNCVIVNSAVR